MKKSIVAGLGLLIAGSAMADTYYLHADMAANSTPNDKTLWWTDPVGGVTQESLGAPTTGNRFDMNGYLFRSQNSSGTATFNGTAVVGSAGSKQDVGFLLYTGTWNGHGLDIADGKNLLIRPHQSSTAMALQTLTVGAGADLTFRTLTGNNNVALSTANISGSGSIGFGITGYANDTNALWTLSITDATPEFTGSVDLVRGQLTFGSAFALDDAGFTVNSAEDNSVVLDNAVSFGSMAYGSSSLAAGTYTATQLNTEFGTTRFSGSETYPRAGHAWPGGNLFRRAPVGSPPFQHLVPERFRYRWRAFPLHRFFLPHIKEQGS